MRRMVQQKTYDIYLHCVKLNKNSFSMMRSTGDSIVHKILYNLLNSNLAIHWKKEKDLESEWGTAIAYSHYLHFKNAGGA